MKPMKSVEDVRVRAVTAGLGANAFVTPTTNTARVAKRIKVFIVARAKIVEVLK